MRRAGGWAVHRGGGRGRGRRAPDGPHRYVPPVRRDPLRAGRCAAGGAARGSAGGSEGDRVTGYVLSTVEDTRALGRRLAAVLRAGDLVVLTGPLGAGKTALAQGIGAGLGVTGQVTSPTFVIARVHRGPLPLVHADAYRIGAVAEIDDLDLDAGLVERLAEAYLEVRIERRDDESRVIELVPHGGDWAERLGALAYERSR